MGQQKSNFRFQEDNMHFNRFKIILKQIAILYDICIGTFFIKSVGNELSHFKRQYLIFFGKNLFHKLLTAT